MNGKAIYITTSCTLAFLFFLYYLILGFYVFNVKEPLLYLSTGYVTTISVLSPYFITFLAIYRFLLNKLSLNDEEIRKIKTEKILSSKVTKMKGLRLSMVKIVPLLAVVLVIYPILAMMFIPPTFYPYIRELEPAQIILTILPSFVIIFIFGILLLYLEFSGKWVDFHDC
jgi:hypothetical protein